MRRVQPGRRWRVPPELLDGRDGHVPFSAAVDSMEVAAQLETSGVSSEVAARLYGRPDVFSLSSLLFAKVPFRTTPPEPPDAPPPAGLRNLGHGLLFAAPTVLFVAAQDSLAPGMAWWSLPVGLTVGWAMSQAVVGLGWILKGRRQHDGDALLATLVAAVGAAAAVAGGVALLFLLAGAGHGTDVAASGVVAAYLVASALLLFVDADVLLAVALAPGLAVVGVHTLAWPVAVSGPVVGWTAAASVALVAVLPMGRAVSTGVRWPNLRRHELSRAMAYLLYGASCGVLASALVVAGHLWPATTRTQAIAVLPLLLSLGVMDWQLAAFRHRAVAARQAVGDRHTFTRRARRLFLWHTGIFVATLLALSGAADVLGRGTATGTTLVLVAEAVLGAALYLGLVLVAADRVELTLVGLIAALATLALVAVVQLAGFGTMASSQGVVDCVAGAGVALVVLGVATWHVVGSPFSY